MPQHEDDAWELPFFERGKVGKLNRTAVKKTARELVPDSQNTTFGIVCMASVARME
jgi:hypothetical protein